MQGQLKSMNNALPNDQKSADAAKQSADVASSSLVLSQQSFKVQQRPYVWVKTPTVTHDGVIGGEPIFMNIELIHAGATPALQVGVRMDVKFSDVTDADFNSLRQWFHAPRTTTLPASAPDMLRIRRVDPSRQFSAGFDGHDSSRFAQKCSTDSRFLCWSFHHRLVEPVVARAGLIEVVNVRGCSAAPR
jgi:hypothetical protein